MKLSLPALMIALSAPFLFAQIIPPYATDFEAANGFSLGSLHGQDSWQVTRGGATIIGTAAAHGVNSVCVTAGYPPAQITRAFGPPAAGCVVYVDFFAWPSAAGTVSLSTLIDAGNSAIGLVGLDAAGHILAFDGDGQGSGHWVVTGRMVPLQGSGKTTDWIRFTLRQDYVAKKWDLYVGARMAAHDLGLRDNAATYLSLFSLTAGLQDNYLDDFYAGEENPLFIDADNDGMDDAWEAEHGLNTATDDRGDDTDDDGLDNVDEYVRSTDPSTADTNDDGLPDGWAVRYGFSPLDNLGDTDAGNVGRTLLQSFQQNLSPWPAPIVADGLRAWYRADAGVVKDPDNRINQWADVSGHGFHVLPPTAEARPLWTASALNGQPAIGYDASAGMTLATVGPVDLQAGSSDLTVIAVVQPEVVQPVASTLLDLSWDGGPRGFHWWQGDGSVNYYYLGWADPGLNAELRTPGLAAAPHQVQILAAVKNGPDATDYVDGTVQRTNTWDVTAMHLPVARFALGNSAADPVRGFHGQIAEILVYNRALTAAERTQIETQLKRRYINPDADNDGLSDEWEDRQLGTRSYGSNDDPGHVGRTLLQSHQQDLSIWPAPIVSDGLRAWYRADAGVVKDPAGKVSRWTDISGHGFHVLQTVDLSRQPVWASNSLNDQPAVKYDASAHMTLETGEGIDLQAGGSDLTIIAVVRPEATQPETSTLLDLSWYGGSYGFHWWQDAGNTNRYHLGWADADIHAEFHTPGLVVTAGQVQILSAVKNGGSVTDYLNGTMQTAATLPLATMNTPVARFAVGNTAAYPDHGFNGQIAEVLIYNRAVSDAERAQIETVLANKYLATTTPVTFSLNQSSFTYTGAAQGPQVVASDPAATFTTDGTLSATNVGTYTAMAAATGNYTGGNDMLAWAIGKAGQTITFPNPGPQVYGGTPLTLNATAGSGLPVVYTVTGPATLNGNTLTFTSTGRVTLTASQAGNDNWKAAANVSWTIAIGLAFNNLDFEQGWVGWTTSSGTAGQVELYVPYGGVAAQGSRAYSSARSSGIPSVDEQARTNQLTSLPFTLPAGITRLSAQLAGGDGYNGQYLYVQLINVATGAEIARLSRAGNYPSWQLRVTTFTLTTATQCRLRIVDNQLATTFRWDYLAVDDIRLETLSTNFSNLDFEQGETGWLPQLGSGGQIASTVSDDQLPVQGIQAYQSAPGLGTVTAANASRTNELWSGTFNVTAGNKLFSGELFAVANAALYVAVINAETGQELCRISKWNSGPTWERRGASFTLTADTLVYVVIVDASDTGYFAVDDLTITPYTFNNLDFEQGWVGWTTTSGTTGQVEPYVPYGGVAAQGSRAYCSARSSGIPSVDEQARTNQLISLPFTLPAGMTRFSAQLAGGDGYNGQYLYVQLINAATGVEIARLSRSGNYPSWQLRVTTFTLTTATQCRLRIVDNQLATTFHWDYLAVDDIHLD